MVPPLGWDRSQTPVSTLYGYGPHRVGQKSYKKVTLGPALGEPHTLHSELITLGVDLTWGWKQPVGRAEPGVGNFDGSMF